MRNKNITEREQKILALRVAGKSYRQIAAELGISPGTAARCAAKFAFEISAAQHANLEEKLTEVGGLKIDRIVGIAKVVKFLESCLTKEIVAELSAPQLIGYLVKLNQHLDKRIKGVKFVVGKYPNKLNNGKIEEIEEFLDFES